MNEYLGPLGRVLGDSVFRSRLCNLADALQNRNSLRNNHRMQQQKERRRVERKEAAHGISELIKRGCQGSNFKAAITERKPLHVNEDLI